MKFSTGALPWFGVAFLMLGGIAVYAADKDEKKDEKSEATIAVGEGKLVLTVPDKWKRVKPKYNMIEHEFSVPAVEADTEDGRVTVMGAGGTVEQNVNRWVAQFTAAAGESLKPKIEKKSVAGQLVHTVDISGNFTDTAGPFSGIKAVEHADYRMLAALIESKDGNYFIKLYGPKKTIGEAEAGFNKMIEGLQAK